MVMNTPLVVAVANISADLCQYIACNPERLSSRQVLPLLFCFPFQQFRRFALCIWTFFCFPPHTYFYSSSTSTSSFSSDEDSHSD